LDTNLVGWADGTGVVQLLGVESETERRLDTRSESLGVAEGNNTRVVDLGLDEGRGVEVGLGADFERDTAVGVLGVVDGAGTSLNVTAYAMVVAGREGVKVVETVEGNGVFRRVVTNSSSIAGDAAGGDVVGGLGTKEESVATENGISRECWALEEVKVGASVETRLLVDGVENSGLSALLGSQRGGKVELETLGDETVNLNLVAEDIGGSPGLSEGQAVGLVGPLALNVTVNGIGLGITSSLDLERHVGRCLGLDLERGSGEVIVLAEQVIGGLAEVLP
jgi:hypothetical protein